jgi:esterase/lipase superfamily enzyme
VSKVSSTWYSQRIGREITVSRWGAVGTPVLIFPTAAGDAEEGERFHLIDAIAPLLEAGRVKAYSLDSIAGQSWLKENDSIESAARVQHQFDQVIVEEVVPAIRQDCGHPEHLQIVLTGASIGAFEAFAAICRHPDLFSKAICLSGTYEPRKFLRGEPNHDWFRASPMLFVPHLDERGPQLARLRQRFVLFAHGTGRWEEPAQSWDAARILGARGVPNRVDEWGKEWDHDWITWRRMLPQYLDEFLP